jgi:hypothetical protein
MSVTVMSRVFWTEIPDLQAEHQNKKVYKVSAHTAKIVLLSMADSADDFGENSFNSMDTLAKKSSLKIRSIPRILRALQQNQYCSYKGLSIYGTSNYSLAMSKLGQPPQKRARTGRPKSSDSGNESSDSSSKSNDSHNESSDSESPDSSSIHHQPSSNHSAPKRKTRKEPMPPKIDLTTCTYPQLHDHLHWIVAHGDIPTQEMVDRYKELELLEGGDLQPWRDLPEMYWGFAEMLVRLGFQYMPKQKSKWMKDILDYMSMSPPCTITELEQAIQAIRAENEQKQRRHQTVLDLPFPASPMFKVLALRQRNHSAEPVVSEDEMERKRAAVKKMFEEDQE